MAKKTKSRPIGEVFQLNGMILEVEISPMCLCTGCIFDIPRFPICQCLDRDSVGECAFERREDRKAVIFKKVTTDGHND